MNRTKNTNVIKTKVRGFSKYSEIIRLSNKKRKLTKHIKKHPKDEAGIKALKLIE